MNEPALPGSFKFLFGKINKLIVSFDFESNQAWHMLAWVPERK
jgi:hypothetical protein